MFDGSVHSQGGEGQYWCEFERTLKGEYCGKRGQLRLDGLLLCETHARELRLEERVAYCRAILAHIELWSEKRVLGAGRTLLTSWGSSGRRPQRRWGVFFLKIWSEATGGTAMAKEQMAKMGREGMVGLFPYGLRCCSSS